MSGTILKAILRLGKPYSISKNVFCTSVGETSSSLAVASPPSPIIVDYNHQNYRVSGESPREAWVEGMGQTGDERLGLASLHPDIFAAVPRLDIIHENVVWQTKYRDINFKHARVPVEMRGPGKGLGKRPWPQKGTGRARFRSTRAPQWVQGGTVHGPRRFATKFYMLPFSKRVTGLISALSAKLAQDDLKIVESLDIPSSDPAFLTDLARERYWGESVLFVQEEDFMPENITEATEQIPHFNLLPVYGLNVYSMLKHDTLVLSLCALNKIQERLLFQLNRPDYVKKCNEKYVH